MGLPGMGQRGFWDKQWGEEKLKIKNLLFSDSLIRFLGNPFVYCLTEAIRRCVKAVLVDGELIH